MVVRYLDSAIFLLLKQWCSYRLGKAALREQRECNIRYRRRKKRQVRWHMTSGLFMLMLSLHKEGYHLIWTRQSTSGRMKTRKQKPQGRQWKTTSLFSQDMAWIVLQKCNNRVFCSMQEESRLTEDDVRHHRPTFVIKRKPYLNIEQRKQPNVACWNVRTLLTAGKL